MIHAKLSITFKLLLITGLIMLQWNCKNPMQDFSNFKLNVDAAPLINPSAILNFNYADNSNAIPSDIQVMVSGRDADLVFDDLGGKDFRVLPDGQLKLILSPRANPDNNHPVIVTLTIQAANCIPYQQDIYLFSKGDPQKIRVPLTKITNLKTGEKFEKIQLNFLGKKQVDTLIFEHTNAAGVKFKYKYPKHNLRFTYTVVTYVDEKYAFTRPINRDSTFQEEYEKDSALNATQFVNDFPLDGKAIKVKAIRNVTRPVIVGYDTIRGTVSVPRYQEVVDTLPIENVEAQIYSTTYDRRFHSAFVNEYRQVVQEPAQFNNVILFPWITFKNAAGKVVNPMYLGGIEGRIIEVDYSNMGKSYSMFVSGDIYNPYNGVYQEVNYVIPKDSIQKQTGNKVAINNTLINVYDMFLFTDYQIGCGYSDIRFDYTNVDVSTFDVNYNIFNNYYYYYGSIPPRPNAQYSVRVPAFPQDDPFEVNLTIDHPANRCQGNKDFLYTKSETTPKPCVFLNTGFQFKVDYNPMPFLEKNSFVPIEVSTDLICITGSKVTLPDQVIRFYRENCEDIRGNLSLRQGKATLLLVPDVKYFFSVINPSNFVEISAGINFDRSKTQPQFFYGVFKDIVRNVTDTAYVGKLTYQPVQNKFNMHIDLFNKILKYKITGCN